MTMGLFSDKIKVDPDEWEQVQKLGSMLLNRVRDLEIEVGSMRRVGADSVPEPKPPQSGPCPACRRYLASENEPSVQGWRPGKTTIDQLQDARDRLRKTIGRAINQAIDDFETETGLQVKEVRVAKAGPPPDELRMPGRRYNKRYRIDAITNIDLPPAVQPPPRKP